MAERRRSGKLAVILHADVAASTGLVRQDEHVAHARIRDTFQRFSDIITRYHGRVRELRGDALLAEFERASGALSAALAFQADHGKYIATLSGPIRPEVRVGIAMGEVVVADRTITGEGVVLAQRLEQLASPGGVVIQAAACETIPSRFPFQYADLGQQEVKGFDKPVQVYSATLKQGAELPSPEQPEHRARNTIAAFASIAMVVAGIALMWLKPWELREEPAAIERMAFPLPDQPSIAVLPFDNFTSDPDQDYFVDGLTEDIITELSRFSELFVISRSSTFTYKGMPVKAGQVAEELGVRYVLEGSVRRTNTELFVTAQLIDATTGVHVWAERYERPLSEFHDIQAEVLDTVVSTVAGRIQNVELRIANRKQTNSLSAYEHVLQGYALFSRWKKESNAQARAHFQKAIELDPQYSRAYSGLAFSHNIDLGRGWSEDTDASFKRAEEASLRAIALDDSDNRPRIVLGWAYINKGDIEKGIAEIKKGVSLNPNDANVLARSGYALTYAGEFEQAMEQVKRAMRINPFHPGYYYDVLGWAQYFLGQYNDALRTMSHVTKPNMAQHRTLAAVYARLGQTDKAREHANQILELDPDFTLAGYAKTQPFRDPDHLAFHLESLRLAGLPDHPPLELPEKPSIAVLPFDDLSPEVPKRSLADGLTETLISTLGQVSDLFVTARNSVMVYRGQATDIREIGRQLGVRYVLEGSVQQTSDKVRVTAQLVDTVTGGHLWAERYDRLLDDIFLLQDEIALNVLVSLQVELTDGEVARLRSSTTKNVDAYLLYQQAVEIFFTFTKEAMIETRRLMDKVLRLDPNFTSAMILKAWTHITDAESGYTNSREESISLAEDELAHMEGLGLELNVLASGEAIMIRAYKELLQGNHTRAVEYGERSVALLPNHPDMLAILGLFLHYAGKNKYAIEVFQKAMRVDPGYKSWVTGAVSKALVLLEDYDAAEISARDGIERASKGRDDATLAIAHQSMAMVYAAQGKAELGRMEIRRALELAPRLSLQSYQSTTHYRNKRDLALLVGLLQTAGLPE